MSEDDTNATTPLPTWLVWTWRIVRVVLILFVISTLAGLFEPFGHLIVGWIRHIQDTLPGLLPKWPKLLLPLGCLALSIVILHRFILWWLAKKGSATDWHAGNTLSATMIILSGAAAAIALSGVVHQVVWLSDEPLYERRGMDIARTEASNSARQILDAMQMFYLEHDDYPETLDKLPIPTHLTAVRPTPGIAREPFLYFKPQPGSGPETVVLVSPVLRQNRMIVIGSLSGVTEVHPAADLPGILETRRMPSKEEP